MVSFLPFTSLLPFPLSLPPSLLPFPSPTFLTLPSPNARPVTLMLCFCPKRAPEEGMHSKGLRLPQPTRAAGSWQLDWGPGGWRWGSSCGQSFMLAFPLATCCLWLVPALLLNSCHGNGWETYGGGGLCLWGVGGGAPGWVLMTSGLPVHSVP